MSEWNKSDRVKISYNDDDLDMFLSITTYNRKVYREDVEKVIEYLKEHKYDFEMNI